MSESRDHIDLVAKILTYVKSLVSSDMHAIIQYDSSDSSRPTKVIGGFIPDVYFWNGNQLIIGEAKTFNDFSRKHSYDQYRAYMKECDGFIGNSLLVIGVPWQIVPTAMNHFRRLKKELETEFSIVIINELGRTFGI